MSTSALPSYAGYRFPAEIISHAVWLYFRFPLSLRRVDELLAARGIVVSHVAQEFGGHAIHDGCALLGKSAQLQAAADATAAAPGAVVAEPLGAVVTAAGLLWPGSRGGPYGVPYLFHPKLDAVRRALVEQAIAHWAKHTRIRLHSQTAGETDYILFAPKDFCALAVGRQGSEQELWVSPDCTVGNVIHEIGHAVGLWHEHTWPDRDLYVEIAWTKISPAMECALGGGQIGRNGLTLLPGLPEDGSHGTTPFTQRRVQTAGRRRVHRGRNPARLGQAARHLAAVDPDLGR